MRNIEIAVLNPEGIETAERTLLAAARLTQRGHKINDLNDFMDLYNKDIDHGLVENLCKLPHVTLQKFAVINVIVIGLSRRALAQLTRHQNEVKFMAGSLQYSDYSEAQRYVIPPELSADAEGVIKDFYKEASDSYDWLVAHGVDPDDAGYVMPQGFRTCLLISATPYQWKHMISQRSCRRNTPEVRYIMMCIWEKLRAASPALFKNCGPDCAQDKCREGRMTCAKKFTSLELEKFMLERKAEDKE